MESTLRDRLDPAHIRAQVADAHEHAREEPTTDRPKEAEPQGDADPRLEPEWVFRLSWQDKRGKLWQGEFANRILTLRQRMQVGVVRARMQAGAPVASLDKVTVELIYMISWLSESLVKKPAWADDLTTLTNEELVQEIFIKVAGHERRFHGLPQPEAESEG